MFQNVIAGVDGFDGGRDAVLLAKALCRGRLSLVTAYPADPVRTRASFPAFEELQRTDVQRMLEATRLEADVDADLVALPDTSPAHALQDHADATGADLIVVGSAHHGPLGRLVLGDVGRAVLHGAPCPVAVAPRRERGGPPRQVAVAFDGSPEARAALDAAVGVSADNGAALTVYVVWEDPPMPVVAAAGSAAYIDEATSARKRRAEELLAGALAELPGNTAGQLLHGHPSSALGGVADRHDLLVVGSRGWGATKRVALGSTSDWLVHHAACAVMVVPRPGGTPGSEGDRDAAAAGVAGG